jgi:AcrR family transcriptional regulator
MPLSTRWLKTWPPWSNIIAVIHSKPNPAKTSAKAPKSKDSAKNNERRRGIVQAAYQTLAEKGFEGLRMREIAKRAGIDHSTLHYYFSG